MNSRIREIRKALNLTQKEFGDKLGFSQNSISSMEKGNGPVTKQTRAAICSRFRVNETWLDTGAGPMFLEENPKKREFFELFDKLSPVFQDTIVRMAKLLLGTQKKLEMSQDEKPPITKE